MNPTARLTNMLVEDVEDELVIYDTENDQAHSLNRTASIVWHSCDGTRTVSEVAAALRREGIAVADDDLVQLSIDYLARAGLMDAAESRSPAAARLARRQLLDRVGVVGVGSLVLPVVETLAAPRAAASSSLCSCSCQPCPPCPPCEDCPPCSICCS